MADTKKPKRKYPIRLSVYLTDDVRNRVKALAEKEQRTASQMASILIVEALAVRTASTL